jgi:two-component system, cell cycle sensor histidine kinase and response regulator CckA
VRQALDSPASFNRLPLNPISDQRTWLRYGLAIVAALAAAVISAQLSDARTQTAYFIFVAAIALASWFGGAGPGLVSTVLSLGICLGFLLNHPETDAGDLWRFVAFAIMSFLVYGLASGLRRTIQALQKANLRFGGVVQISEDAIITADENFNVSLFNPGAEAIFGYKKEEVLGKPLGMLLPERYRAMHEQHMRNFLKSPDVLRAMNQRGHIYGLRKTGEEFPAEASISKFKAAGETVMTVRMRDISERIAADQGLKQLASIVESSDDAIVGATLEGVITSWNHGAERMYGYSAAEIVGKNVVMLAPPERAGEPLEYLQTAKDGESTRLDTVRVTKEGRCIEVALTVSPIRDRHGAPVGVSTVARDVTERRRLEEQLRQSQKMEAIGRLAGGVAHDFNNMLSVIVGYTYLIQSSSAKGDGVRNAADQVMGAAERASSLTRQLLAFSRKEVVQPEVVGLNSILNGMEKMLPRLIGEDIDLKMIQGTDLHEVKVDPGQIEQVIMNLVVNARDAMPQGGKLTIETTNVEFDEHQGRTHGASEGSYVLLAVSDTGEGMDADTKARIFEPFFTTKDPGKGTGLGLATVYAIVQQSNGYIWVYSEKNAGTTFKIYLPVTKESASKPRVSSEPELSLCGTETLLLVEDEEKLRVLLENVLREQGYRVLAAPDGPSAIRLAEEHDGAIDVLLTDVIMPQMRGQQLAQWVAERYPEAVVIFMSGYTDNALIHAGALQGTAMLLQKPFTPDFVLRKLRRALDTSKQRAVRRKAV